MDATIISGRPTTRQEMAVLLKDAVARGRANAVILAFWSAFPWATCGMLLCPKSRKCVHGTCHSRASKLRFLQAMAAIQIRETDADRRKLVRATFKTYRSIIKEGKPCFVCGENEANHRHHILQIQNGGHNGPKNIVLLCDPCHRDVHKHA